MKRHVRRFLDWLLGPRCVCDARVFPADQAAHDWLEHAGDRPPDPYICCATAVFHPGIHHPDCTRRRP